MRPCRWLASFVLCLALFLPSHVSGQTPVTLTNLTGTSVAKAAPDECWAGLGNNVSYDFPPCAAGKSLKVNQSYVWSLVEAGDYIWFGTTANPICTTGGEAAGRVNSSPYQTQAWACEFDKSPYSPNPYSGPLGDLRPPKIYIYNKTTHALTNITPTGPVTRSNPLGLDTDIIQTIGLRSATVIGNHVVFAGLNTSGGLNFYAFRVSDGGWVAKAKFSTYSNLRRFANLNGVTYAAVKTNSSGALLRYTGTIPDTLVPPPAHTEVAKCSTCFTFSQVESFPNEGAELAVHNGRIYVGTWITPVLNHVSSTASIYMSPAVPEGGLTSSTGAFTKIFDIAQYEPDPLIVQTYGIGAMHSFGGYLYFGTDIIPKSGALLYFKKYGLPNDPAAQQEVYDKTMRSTTVFRISGEQQGTPNLELLYGDPQLWVYMARPTSAFVLTPNKLGRNGTYGLSGFGHPFNAYSWSMAVLNNHLYVGTFDWLYDNLSPPLVTLGRPVSSSAVAAATVPPPDPTCGADLYSFADANSPAVAETLTGVNNYTSYGVRNLLTGADGQTMWLGMANPMNLLTDPNSGYPLGGWELIRVTAK